MFEEPIRRITINNDIANWLKEALREGNKSTLQLQKNRLNSLNKQHDKVNARLSRLYDVKFDGEIAEDLFQAKESEYRTQLIEIKSQIDSANTINPNFYEDGCKILELSKRLYCLYVKANYEEKGRILKFVALNFILDDLTLYPTYRKPFDLIAVRTKTQEWGG